MKYFYRNGKIRDDFYDLLRVGSIADAKRIVDFTIKGLLSEEESKKAMKIIFCGRFRYGRYRRID